MTAQRTAKYPPFVMVPKTIERDRRIKPLVHRLYSHIADCAGVSKSCQHTNAEIADLTGLSVPTITRARKILVGFEYIEVTRNRFNWLESRPNLCLTQGELPLGPLALNDHHSNHGDEPSNQSKAGSSNQKDERSDQEHKEGGAPSLALPPDPSELRTTPSLADGARFEAAPPLELPEPLTQEQREQLQHERWRQKQRQQYERVREREPAYATAI